MEASNFHKNPTLWAKKILDTRKYHQRKMNNAQHVGAGASPVVTGYENPHEIQYEGSLNILYEYVSNHQVDCCITKSGFVVRKFF